ncbi:3-hydroxyacyl-CoA dehydrogenase NAD-binding domain-containing protein [Dasania marina]|uniref:3-hydroxyacyl-CoA dehydrogenase NAD-binding domain-containing protein n=1 Tax=Dasania marina TaxID=471499 RepID=UPI0030DA939C
MTVVDYYKQDRVGVIQLDNPPVNALSQALRGGILGAIEQAHSDDVAAIVLYCKGKTFIAGADIKEFGKPPQSPALAEVLAALEGSAKPIVAAIHGTALGGGLEVALACHYRCALSSASMGLPEVNLGLLPGGGGTQRLPRLVGVEKAMEMILNGKPVAAQKALEIGIIDRVMNDNLLDGALQFANELIDEGVGATNSIRRTGELAIECNSDTAQLIADTRERVAKRYRGFLSPHCIVSAVEAATQLPLLEGLKRERELFLECMTSPQSKALRYQFFAERQASKILDLDKTVQPRSVAKVAVIGAGTMGAGITMCFANAGIPVTLLEVQSAALERGLATIDKNYRDSAKKGRMTESQVEQRLSLIKGCLNYDELADVDLVVEAVFESLEVKKQVFQELDRVCKPGVILASNTSYLDLNKIAAFTQRPEDVIGMHFFSPANIMKLLEVVRGEYSSDDVIATVMQLGKKIGKVTALVGVGYGFVGNRLFSAYCREAQMLLLEGATPSQVDQAMVDWGMAMGPLSVLDMAGLDIGYKARQARTDLPDDPCYFHIGNVLVEQGRLGQKSSAGFYSYDPKTRQRAVDPAVEHLIVAEAKRLGVPQRKIEAKEIVERLLYTIINEACHLLEEGIAQRPSDIDLILANGYGFPRYRGGPIYYAETVGLINVLKRVEEFHASQGSLYWQPAPLLRRMAAEGEGFKSAI